MSFLDMALAHSAQWSQILDGLKNFTHRYTIFPNIFQIVKTFGLDLISFFARDFGNLKKEFESSSDKFFN